MTAPPTPDGYVRTVAALETGIVTDSLTVAAERCLQRAVDHLLELQEPAGFWCGELEGDSILQSEYILTMWIIGRERDPRLPRITNHLRQQQRESGSWAQYPGGTAGGGLVDLGATVKAYFALKLMGDDPESPHMVRARRVVLDHGGAERINSFSKFYLAALGQVGYSAVPTIPAQIVYLPRWFYFHLTKVSAWSRTMIVPLAIVSAYKPVRDLPEPLHIDELFADPRARHALLATGFGRSTVWTRLFLGLDRLLKALDKLAVLRLFREPALKRLERWLVDHCRGSDGPGAIFPPIVYLLIALRACRGFADDHPVIRDNLHHLDNYMIYGARGRPRTPPDAPESPPPETPTASDASPPGGLDDTIHLQPCESPVWDTGIAAYALSEAGLGGDHPAMARCADWLVSKECRERGDWSANVDRSVVPSGWYFEFNNPFYPDIDDTVMVAMALKRLCSTAPENPRAPDGLAAAERSVGWVLAMQNDDGGWAAFDKTRDRPLLECVPFADHNAIQDPSCPDITGRTLECLGHHGYGLDHPAVRRAIGFIRSRQEQDGCWFGRWGVNYIYGTWQVLGGLQRVGCDTSANWIQHAGRWLRDHQQPGGSFGESADSYEDPTLRGAGPPTASQTAWGTMALLAVYGPHDDAVRRSIQWLCNTQLESGNWAEDWFTGTGFPKVFYLRYHYYRLYFPIMAIGRWRRGMVTGEW